MELHKVGLRERTRRAVRGELIALAMDLFLSQGFEETTVEQIAAAAGLSRRSYFRYFSSKDEVFAEGLAAIGRDIAAALARQPSEEKPWRALRAAFGPLLAGIEEDERMRSMSRMMLENPALQSSHAHKQTSWVAAMADELQPRLGENSPRIRAEALAGAAISCLTTAQAWWVMAGNEQPLSALLDRAMDAVHPLVAASVE